MTGRASPGNAVSKRGGRVIRRSGARSDCREDGVEVEAALCDAKRLDRTERDALGGQRPRLVAEEGVDPTDRLDRALPLRQRAEA